jgi:plasmid stabilization system protein ParE
MSKPLRLHQEARAELEEAATWYEERDTGLGEQFLNALTNAFAVIERTPQAFNPASTCPSGRDVRRYVVSQFPYSVFYEVRDEEILVLAVAHQRRRPGHWVGRVDEPNP